MLLSRFWYLVLAVAAVSAITMALLTRGMFNREYVERLLSQVRKTGVDSLNRDERAFLERMANLEAPPRRDVRPQPDLWPFPA